MAHHARVDLQKEKNRVSPHRRKNHKVNSQLQCADIIKVLHFSHFTHQTTRKYETYLIPSETLIPGGREGQGGREKVRGYRKG